MSNIILAAQDPNDDGNTVVAEATTLSVAFNSDGDALFSFTDGGDNPVLTFALRAAVVRNIVIQLNEGLDAIGHGVPVSPVGHA